ncbi:carbamoyltransferase HypF [Gehongia tenuis]|uniref:Carbamoyltransferase n=1 Tax=Gehongia tenuis TaxID=2763655 RepID=A0A926D518_9FIRM|nr:carbamoyltransferase HypF [Gehongia tenuis]MBC8531477.1 carbamoyltransferase HypF [Gehongia tenuis]
MTHSAWHITVLGVVQGVGYRPYVARLAEKLELTGWVRNEGGIVQIFAEGPKPALEKLLFELRNHPPFGAAIDEVAVQCASPKALPSFTIADSRRSDGIPLFPPDLALCADCRREVMDPGDRRYRYPFISCVACGPRYSILEELPYDRARTAMSVYAQCPECQKEYAGGGRRRHAQTLSCHQCGPQLIFETLDGRLKGEAALDALLKSLHSGGVVAIKGIGGFQLVCSPLNERAVKRLRAIKGREQKPFAVMFPDLPSVAALCSMSEAEIRLIESPARPIVLLEKREDPFSPEVAGGSRYLGVFLPYTALHLILTDKLGPLVVTSANPAGEPIWTEDGEALVYLSMLDGVAYHDRVILTPLDDSVVQVAAGAPRMVRRSRGYVPRPIFLQKTFPRPLLAMGGDLKAGFALAVGNRVYPSQYLGDMKSLNVLKNYRGALSRMERIFQIRPETAVCDLHPGYETRRLAHQMFGRVLEVQHHHAHIASIMAEYDLDEVLGVAFDGTGYGTDGTIWGGEFLLCRGSHFEREGHLQTIPICGGDEAAKNAGLALASFKHAAGLAPENPREELVQRALEGGIKTVLSSSAGRLFDAMSALLGVRDYNSYEGECAIALENLAAKTAPQDGYPLQIPLKKGDAVILDSRPLIRDARCALDRGVSPGALARGFHEALAKAIVETLIHLREKYGIRRAALGGGVFANRILMERCSALIQENGFEIYLPRQMPIHDGGIALGQAYLGLLKGMEA